MRYPRLFSEMKIGELSLPNRIMMAAMSSGLADERGFITHAQIAYYAERARGGVGMVMVEFACVDSSYGLSEPRQVVIDTDEAIAGHRRLVEAIKGEGARAALQLQLPGQFARTSSAHGPAAPSEVLSRKDGSVRARELAPDEVSRLVARFGEAAERAVRAGYEAIELHGAHGYLLNAFLTPLMNHRNDEWGGDFERRLAFPVAVIREVKARIGSRPLLYRLSAEEYREGGLGIEDTAQLVPFLVAAGADGIDISTGTLAGSLERTIDPMSLEGWRFELAARVREHVDVPVTTVGTRWPEAAEQALETGKVDFIALGRPLLADPDWAAKAREDRNDDIRPCTSCNWCADRVFQELPVGCAENPRAGRELIPLTVHAAPTKRRLAVVGSGPGGLSAAIQASSIGFDVTLFEADDKLGGGLISSAAPPHKENLLWYLDYLLQQVDNRKIDVRIGTRATVDELAALNPAAVILAQGTVSVPLGIPGENLGHVHSAYEMLIDGTLPPVGQGPVVVYGGGETGCETAELLAEHGMQVMLVSRSAQTQLARDAEPLYRKGLLARLASNPLITLLPHTHLDAISEHHVTLRDGADVRSVEARQVVIAQGRRSNQGIHDQLVARGIESVLIGDAKEIRRIGEAVHEANDAVRALIGTGAEAPPA